MSEPKSETPQTLRPNNRYLLARIAELGGQSRSLDFGCGNGALVASARDAGFEAYGAETFYDGHRSEDADLARSWGLDNTIVREIKTGILDFPDDFFDIVVHNQVFEHVENLGFAAAEIYRVLKPGGIMIGIFPTLGVIREPHLSLPCVHWFKPGPARDRWAKLTRRLGFGFDFWGEGDAWFERAFPFLDERVFFRTRRETARILDPVFELKWVEPDWLAFRVPKCKWMLSLPFGRIAARTFSHVIAGVVVEAASRKEPALLQRNAPAAGSNAAPSQAVDRRIESGAPEKTQKTAR
jgi:SAM-dependent methyltransferase